MNKKVWMGVVAVFIFTQPADILIHQYLLDATYLSAASLRQSEGAMKLWLYPVLGIISSYFFALIFSYVYQGKGIVEGARYGLYVSFLMVIPQASADYVVLPIPLTLAIVTFMYTAIEYIVAGIILAAVFKSITGTSPTS